LASTQRRDSPRRPDVSTPLGSPRKEHVNVEWPDFGMPADAGVLRQALVELRRRAAGDDVLEVGCLGGPGRTGTALACLAVLAEIPAEKAVGWVRANYCPKAVETVDREAFVVGFSV
jgi:protein-tyrosine phosphatase